MPHIMKAHKTTAYPTNLLFVDCETKGVIDETNRSISRHYLWFGYANSFEYRKQSRTRNKECFFTNKIEFWRFVESRLQYGKPLYVFAHNITFDLTVLDVWGLSERNDWEVEFAVIDDPPIIVKFDIGGKKMVLIDTFNYFKCSVAELGESLGLKKLKMPRMNESFEKWKRYCKRDVDVITGATLRMFDYFTENELGGFGYTIAGLALNTYKRKFMEHEIFIHDNDTVNKLERDSYFGGLVESYFLGEVQRKSLYVLDVNSMYPYVMQKDFPTKLLFTKSNVSTKNTLKLLDEYAVIARVQIKSKERTYPIRHEGKLIYANGEFTTTLVGPELATGLFHMDVCKVELLAAYQKEKIFEAYVQYFWKRRIESKRRGDLVDVMFCKYMLNSLYGKFGQQLNSWQPLTYDSLHYLYHAYGVEYPKDYELTEPKIEINGTQTQWYPIGFEFPIPVRRICKQLQIRIPRGEHNESFPAIAAYVTAYARCYLQKIRSIAGTINVYYCDTDSIITNISGYRKLQRAGYENASKLGKLKCELKANYACFFGLKDYIIGNTIKTKGVRKDAIQIGENEFLQNQFEGLKSVLKREREPYITISWIRKQLSREYTKGTRTKSGWVTPFTL